MLVLGQVMSRCAGIVLGCVVAAFGRIIVLGRNILGLAGHDAVVPVPVARVESADASLNRKEFVQQRAPVFVLGVAAFQVVQKVQQFADGFDFQREESLGVRQNPFGGILETAPVVPGLQMRFRVLKRAMYASLHSSWRSV